MLDTIRLAMGLIMIFQSGVFFAVWAIEVVEAKTFVFKNLLWCLALGIFGLYFVISRIS